MKPIGLKPIRYRQYLKALAVVAFIATPGSLLVLPLVAWWTARKGQRSPVVAP